MMTEEEMKEFTEWKRTRAQSEIDAAFFDLEELFHDMRGYNIAMPPRAFKTVVRALLLLRREVHGLIAKD